MPHPRRLPRAAFALAGVAAAVLVATAPADVVILKDGFVIQGNVRKEMESVRDPATGAAFSVPKGNGLDTIDDGARVVIFSSHHKQLGEISKEIKLRPEYKAYTNRIESRRTNHQFSGYTAAKELPDFNAKWKRTIEVQVPGGFDRIDQQVTYLDPYTCYVVSPTHIWTQTFRTIEMDPLRVRKLLSTHPDLIEADGKPDPLKRVAIARFLKDVGWLYLAQEEIAKLKEVPAPLPKEAQEQLDKLVKEVDAAAAELVAGEAEFALAAGRYAYAAEVLAAFPEKTANPADLDRFIRVKAQLETARDQHAAGRRLLRALIDDATGGGVVKAYLALGGGPAAAVVPTSPVADPRLAALAAAAAEVYAELHPDTIGRVEFFVNMAAQVERERATGKEPSKKPAELLATAISGWAKGKNGATTLPDLALKVWAARDAALAYQRAPNLNERNAVLARFKQNHPVGLDELVQVISLLPPAEPENLEQRSGTAVKPGNGVPEGVYLRKSAPFGASAAGLEYVVKLPPEYHHGRAYPVLMMLTYPGLDPERFMGAVSGDAGKRGYILVAPVWASAFGAKSKWDWNAADHEYVTATLRDVVRHFTVDNDRVFLVGAAAGADMAMDVGASHPDLFAGVVAVGPNPKWQGFFIDYWRNTQKLPVYVVSGELAGDANLQLRRIFDRWMPNGFPALEVVYRGRGIEWYPAEVPVVFDWMGRKKRPSGAAILQLGNVQRFPWFTNREEDNRFYWLGAEKIDPRNLAASSPGRSVIPAELQGDIKGNNLIELRTRGVRVVSVWLGRDMIDWAKPVRVLLNGVVPNGYKPKVLAPDPQVLLEDYWHRGDRRMLYLNKLEFASQN